MTSDTEVRASTLLEPAEVAGLRLRNRFVMAPMTRKWSPGGIPGPDVVAYYKRRAASLGLIVTEGTYVDHPSAGSSDEVPRFYGEDALAGWAEVVEAVHAAGAAIFPQLWHLGATRQPGSPPHPEAPVLSPSGIHPDGSRIGSAATTADLDRIIGAFVQGALDAQRLGFDGVELHGAHGYLLDQFHWPRTNTRTDPYGGPITGRARLSAEIVAAIREAVGPDLPICLRYSQWKVRQYDARNAESPAELEEFLVPLAEAGVSMFHASTRRYWEPAFPESPLTLAGWTRKLTGVPVIGLGSVGVSVPFGSTEDGPAAVVDLAPLERLVANGEFDLVGIGRAVIGDAEWVRKVAENRAGEIVPYTKAAEAIRY